MKSAESARSLQVQFLNELLSCGGGGGGGRGKQGGGEVPQATLKIQKMASVPNPRSSIALTVAYSPPPPP